MRTFHFQFIGIVMGLMMVMPLFSQSIGINDDGSQPNAAAILDIKSSNKGLLIPRTDTTTINTLGTPTNGLIIYQTSDDVFYYYDGSRWRGLHTSDRVVFERNGSLIRQKGNIDDDDFIFGKDALPISGESVTDNFFFFDQDIGAFRSGSMFSSLNWSPDSIGLGSFAFGDNTKASGLHSTAWGSLSKASGEYSTAFGSDTKATHPFSTAWGAFSEASGTTSTAWGAHTQASGSFSTAWGIETHAESYLETVLGQYNTDYSPMSYFQWNPVDRLFVIGNGTGTTTRSNALTILKNGNTTLKGELTLTDGTSAYALPNTDGTADQVLSTDGGGAVTWVDGDSKGVFERNGNLIRQKDNWYNDDFILGGEALPINESLGNGDLFFFDQSEAAFRCGALHGSTHWAPDSIGYGSFAFGYSPKAKGSYSVAWGNSSQAIGNVSTAWGLWTKAHSAYETVLGGFNTNYIPNSIDFWNENDRLFVIGNGSSSSDRSNALTMLKNGNTTLKGELTLTDGTSPYTLPNTDGTVDQVLSTDGAGIMSWTDRDDFGVFERDGNLIRQKDHVDDDDFIFGRDALPTNGEGVTDDFFFFDQSMAAIRSGKLNSSLNWSPDSIGYSSFAFGYNTKAKGTYSAAWGEYTKATGDNSTAWGSYTKAIGSYSTAWGEQTTASNFFSTAWGSNTKASGAGCTAWGQYTEAPSALETVLGRYNTSYEPINVTNWNNEDRLFVIGNGTPTARSNALTILKNGNTTLKGELTLTDGTSEYTLPNTDGAADQVLSTDGAGALTWQDGDSFGVFERDGNFIKQKSNYNDDFVLGRDALPINGVYVFDDFLFFDQSKGAFRSGVLAGSHSWSPDSLGLGSFAFGRNTKAKGLFSTAWGFESESLAHSSTAWGAYSIALREGATAWGGHTIADGYYSTSWGKYTHAKSYVETTIGQYNTNYSPFSKTSWNLNDRLFVIGNGTDSIQRSNALTILKNGNTTLKGELTLTDGTSPYTLPNTDGNADQVLSTDGAGSVSWEDGDSFGVFERDGNLIRQKDHMDDDDFIFGRDALPTNGEIVTDTFFFFDQSKAAFRGGELSHVPFWSPDSIGFGSFAFGKSAKAIGEYSTAFGKSAQAIGDYSTAWGWARAIGQYSAACGEYSRAIGQYSTAWGSYTEAIGDYSTALGERTDAIGKHSTALGQYTEAIGDYSTAWGYNTKAHSANETVLGRYNTDYTPNSNTMWSGNDRLFVIGNGTTAIDRSNALTVIKNGDVVFGRDALPINGESVTEKFISFDKSKGALRIGELNSSPNWSPENSGIGSLAWGYNCKAKGDYSTAKGFDAWAIGYSSSAWGYLTNANKEYSTAWGGSTTANGNYSTAWGNHTHAESHLETVLGQYDTDYTPNSTSVWNDNDRLFVIGSGTSTSNRKNALTVLKNGCTGLQNVNTPTYALHLPNSSSNDKGKGLAYAWTTYSDTRIKSQQVALDYGLNEIIQLSPKSYFQHHSDIVDERLVVDTENGKKDIGLIAQEVYDIIPEVVNKPENENLELWGMNYEKLVPVLINAIQEQQQMIEQLEQSLIEEKEDRENINARLEKMEKMLSNTNTMR